MIHCKYDKLIDPKTLKDHPKNRNKHGQDQIERLAELYKYHEIRHPIIVSKLSGYIVAGHGRKLAAIRAGLKEFPVVYQDFESIEKEYAFMQSDNAIATWAELDIDSIKLDISEFQDFDITSLGLPDFKFKVDMVNAGTENDEWVGMPDFESAENDIKLIIYFDSENERENFAEKHNIEITRKQNNQWISRG